jgi:hypothetical protein
MDCRQRKCRSGKGHLQKALEVGLVNLDHSLDGELYERTALAHSMSISA